MSTGDIVITKVYFPEGQTLSSQVKADIQFKGTGRHSVDKNRQTFSWKAQADIQFTGIGRHSGDRQWQTFRR